MDSALLRNVTEREIAEKGDDFRNGHFARKKLLSLPRQIEVEADVIGAAQFIGRKFDRPTSGEE